MRSDELLSLLKTTPENIEFSQVMAVIEQNYDYSPAKFSNGDVVNEAGTNEGSCKLFAFAQLQDLDQAQTLALFGQYYRDVLATPDGNDHGNIRNFINTGWQGIEFSAQALIEK